ncbi:uncharacterized protein [Littorina saxatilis]|uniref:non-specific serine/threonine protein kinase n=1 Tax=Littorina saxatilis TaxID=31220 RepID=A0AAN9GCL6_9CAEN
MSREVIKEATIGDIVPCPWRRGSGGSGHCQLQLLSVLQHGNFSRTFKCKDIANDEQFLVKRVCLTGLTDSDFQSRLREVDIWKMLRHPHILKCHYGWHRSESELWILSETASQSVEQLVLTKAREPPQALFEKWLYQLASALKYLHEDQATPVLHRNVKPSNIMVADHFTLKLSDFGFCKQLSGEDDMARSRVGTGHTMSPEMLSNLPYNATTDIWSMGISVVYIATQHHAVHAKTFQTLFKRTSQGQVRGIAGQYDKSVEEVVNSLLQVDPVLRPSASQLLKDLKLRFKNCSKPLCSRDSYPGRDLVPQRTRSDLGFENNFGVGGSVGSAGGVGEGRVVGQGACRHVGMSQTVVGVSSVDRRPGERRGNRAQVPGSNRIGPGIPFRTDTRHRRPSDQPEDEVDGDANMYRDFGLPVNDGGYVNSSSTDKEATNTAVDDARPSASTQKTQFRSSNSPGHPSSSSSKATQYPTLLGTETNKEPATASRTTQYPSIREDHRRENPTDNRNPDQPASTVDSLCLTILCLIIDDRCSRRSTTTTSHNAEKQPHENATRPTASRNDSGRRKTSNDVTPAMTSESVNPSDEVQMINTFPGAFNVRRAPQKLTSTWEVTNPQTSSRSTRTGKEEKEKTLQRQRSEPNARGVREPSEDVLGSGGDVVGTSDGRSFGSQSTLSVDNEASWPTNLRQYFTISRDLLSKLSPEVFFTALNYARLFSKEEVTMWLQEQAGQTGIACIEDIVTLVQLNEQLDVDTVQAMHRTLLQMGDPGHTSI